MGINTPNHENSSSLRAPGTAALTLAAAMAAFSTQESTADASCPCPGTIEVSSMNLKMKGNVQCGVLKMNLDGCVGSSLNAEFNLTGHIQQSQIDALNGKDVLGTFEGTLKDGKLEGRLHITSPMDINLPVSIPLQQCGGTADSPKSAVSHAVRPAAKKIVKEEEPAKDASVNLVKIPEPLTPGTFFVDKPDSKYTLGGMKGFEITSDSEVTFFVTGPAKVWINFYPLVFTNEGKRNAEKPMQARITVDSETFETSAQMPATDGAPIPGTEGAAGENQGAVWNKPVRVGPFDVPAGSMREVTVSTPGYDFKVTVEGVVETRQPSALAAGRTSSEDNPNYPAKFGFACRASQAVEAPAGLTLDEVTPSPLTLGKDGLAVEIERFRNSALVTVHLHTGEKGKDGYVEYKLEQPLPQAYTHPNDSEERECAFVRTYPPAESTDPTGPNEIQVAVDLKDETAPKVVDLPAGPHLKGTMQCQFNDVAHSNPHVSNLDCWERNVQTAQIRAYRATLAKRHKKLPKIPLVHTLRKY